MSESINKEAAEGAVKAVIESEQVKNMTVPLSKSIGTALDDFFSLSFGGWLHERAEKSRLKHQKNIEEFKEKLYSDVEQIPNDNFVPPKESIIGPALEASKYYFEETEIRDMFEKLIVNSMDNRKSSKVLPCFTEIIKQLTPLDAQNLVLFDKPVTLPIAEYRIKNEDKSYNIIHTNVFLENSQCQNLDLQSISLSSLRRVGLIEVHFDSHLTQKHIYDKFENTREFEELKLYVEYNNKRNGSKRIMTVAPGQAILTPLGQAFIDVCLS